MSEIKKESKTKKTTTKKTTPKKEKVVKEEKKEKKVSKVTVKKTKETKEESILTTKEQKWYKVLSKIIYVVTKILRICLMICVPFIFIAMILIPIVFNKFEVNANIVKFGDMNIIVRDDSLAIKIGDTVQVLDCEASAANQIMEFLSTSSKTSIITFCEASLLLFGVIIVLYIYLLTYVEKIFYNFVKQKTPFTKDNTQNIFMIGTILCIIKIISIFSSLTSLFSIKSATIDSAGIMEILLVLVLYFVFKYATGMQEKVDTTLYE